MILMVRSYAGICNFGRGEGEGRQKRKGIGAKCTEGPKLQREVPFSPAINADCAELPR